jgi:hypothetical protein
MMKKKWRREKEKMEGDWISVPHQQYHEWRVELIHISV